LKIKIPESQPAQKKEFSLKELNSLPTNYQLEVTEAENLIVMKASLMLLNIGTKPWPGDTILQIISSDPNSQAEF